MDSLERKIRAVPPPDPDRPSPVDARLANLEDEAEGLRAELAALREDIHWLSGSDHDAEPGWLARGWVRASLLLATVGLILIVSLPYLLNGDPPDLPQAPAPEPAAVAPPTEVARPAPTPATRPRMVPIPAPIPVRRTETPASPAPPVTPTPSRAVVTDEQPVSAPPPRVMRTPQAAAPAADAVVAPVQSENSP
jgi:hypothetical protein